jgi:hypothetical protein
VEIPLQLDYCIVCCTAPANSLEHIIPAALGGRLKVRILCEQCNNELGYSLVGVLKDDPSIRLAIENLSTELPESFQEDFTYIGSTPEGTKIRVKRKKGKNKVVSDSYQGILIQDTGVAQKTLKTKLAKSGMLLEEVEVWARVFSELEEEQPLITPNGEVFIKRELPQMRPELSTHLIDDRLPVLIAYEFLAVAIGSSIYHPIFDGIRDYIQGGEKGSQIIVTHLGGGKKYEAIHGLVIEPYENGVKILVRLFRWITYEIKFEGLHYGGPDAVYLEDLRTPKSLIALSHEDAKNGKWYTT